jgi:hypothetical protein
MKNEAQEGAPRSSLRDTLSQGIYGQGALVT